MIEKIFIISFLVFAIHYTLQPGEIFGRLGDWFYKHLPSWTHQPLYDCPVCMVFWHGTAIYWLVWATGWKEWLVVVIAAMGLNAIIVKVFPKENGEDPKDIKMHYGR